MLQASETVLGQGGEVVRHLGPALPRVLELGLRQGEDEALLARRHADADRAVGDQRDLAEYVAGAQALGQAAVEGGLRLPGQQDVEPGTACPGSQMQPSWSTTLEAKTGQQGHAVGLGQRKPASGWYAPTCAPGVRAGSRTRISSKAGAAATRSLSKSRSSTSTWLGVAARMVAMRAWPGNTTTSSPKKLASLQAGDLLGHQHRDFARRDQIQRVGRLSRRVQDLPWAHLKQAGAGVHRANLMLAQGLKEGRHRQHHTRNRSPGWRRCCAWLLARAGIGAVALGRREPRQRILRQGCQVPHPEVGGRLRARVGRTWPALATRELGWWQPRCGGRRRVAGAGSLSARCADRSPGSARRSRPPWRSCRAGGRHARRG